MPIKAFPSTLYIPLYIHLNCGPIYRYRANTYWFKAKLGIFRHHLKNHIINDSRMFTILYDRLCLFKHLKCNAK